jgi:hypothetical protein
MRNSSIFFNFSFGVLVRGIRVIFNKVMFLCVSSIAKYLRCWLLYKKVEDCNPWRGRPTLCPSESHFTLISSLHYMHIDTLSHWSLYYRLYCLWCYRSAEDAYTSATPDPSFAFVGGPCCLALDFVIAFWIMITFYTLLTSLFCLISETPIGSGLE